MKTVRYVKNTLAKFDEDAYLPSLHLSTVELQVASCKLQEKLHRVAWPLQLICTHLKYVCGEIRSIKSQGNHSDPSIKSVK